MKRIYFMAMMAVLMLLTACEHKDLCIHHPHIQDVKVVFDWKNVTDNVFPESMVVFFFPVEGGEAERYDFSDIQGGTIDMMPGAYRVLCLNRDTEANQLDNIHSWEDFKVYTRQTEELVGMGVRASGAPRAEGAEEQPMIITPDRLWTDCLEYITIDETSGQVITLYPKLITRHYTFEINNVELLQYVNSMSGSLSGMSGSFYVTSEKYDDLSTLSFEADRGGKLQISGEFHCFSHCTAQHPLSHYLMIYITMSDGSKYYYTFDVTDQVHGAPDPYHVHIVLDQLELPQPITNDGGFKPTVDDWVGEDVDLNM